MLNTYKQQISDVANTDRSITILLDDLKPNCFRTTPSSN